MKTISIDRMRSWATALLLIWMMAIFLTPATLLAQPWASGFQPVASEAIPLAQLRAGHKNVQSRVLPSGVSPRTAPKTATFIVTYFDFTPAAEAAFQHAVDLWEQQISSPVPIRVQATWVPLEPGILGSARANRFWTNGTYTYPDALADAINGSDLGGGDFDIIANFNSNFTWYFGTDANPPADEFDLVTVVLHELAHGLGFAGLMTVESGIGFWIFSDPAVYAAFTEDLDGTSIVDTETYPDGSMALGDVLQSGNVFVSGKNAVAANLGVRPELFAPEVWLPGSSYSHFDEMAFPAGDPDSLMTPFLNFAEAIHSPGDIALCLFQDTGWTTHAICDSKIFMDGFETGDTSAWSNRIP